MSMKPTPQLRFIERYVSAAELEENTGRVVRILQQWWAIEDWDGDLGEWRDVPLETEQ
jgi:hypothetical protein